MSSPAINRAPQPPACRCSDTSPLHWRPCAVDPTRAQGSCASQSGRSRVVPAEEAPRWRELVLVVTVGLGVGRWAVPLPVRTRAGTARVLVALLGRRRGDGR